MTNRRIEVLAKHAMASGAAEHKPAIEMIPKDLSQEERNQVVAQINLNETKITHALRKVTP
jgi:hypothetical protein